MFYVVGPPPATARGYFSAFFASVEIDALSWNLRHVTMGSGVGGCVNVPGTCVLKMMLRYRALSGESVTPATPNEFYSALKRLLKATRLPKVQKKNICFEHLGMCENTQILWAKWLVCISPYNCEFTWWHSKKLSEGSLEVKQRKPQKKEDPSVRKGSWRDERWRNISRRDISLLTWHQSEGCPSRQLATCQLKLRLIDSFVLKTRCGNQTKNVWLDSPLCLYPMAGLAPFYDVTADRPLTDGDINITHVVQGEPLPPYPFHSVATVSMTRPLRSVIQVAEYTGCQTSRLQAIILVTRVNSDPLTSRPTWYVPPAPNTDHAEPAPERDPTHMPTADAIHRAIPNPELDPDMVQRHHHRTLGLLHQLVADFHRIGHPNSFNAGRALLWSLLRDLQPGNLQQYRRDRGGEACETNSPCVKTVRRLHVILHVWVADVQTTKIARRCGAKHISKSKCAKHLSSGALLEVALSKKCTLLWHQAHFQVKTYKAPQLWSTFRSCAVEKVHAVVARSTFASEKAKSTSRSENFSKFALSKKCTLLWRGAYFEVKMYKTQQQVRTTLGSWDVEKVHAVVARSTFRSQNVQNNTCSRHFWTLKRRFARQAQGIVHLVKSEQNVRVL